MMVVSDIIRAVLSVYALTVLVSNDGGSINVDVTSSIMRDMFGDAIEYTAVAGVRSLVSDGVLVHVSDERNGDDESVTFLMRHVKIGVPVVITIKSV